MDNNGKANLLSIKLTKGFHIGQCLYWSVS